jgi:hypothetical protein
MVSCARLYCDWHFMASNVSAVYEVPKLTARSAEGFPRPILIDTFHGLPWQGREAADA